LGNATAGLVVYTQGSAAQKREAVGEVVSMVLPRTNTEGQPGLPFYCPVKSGVSFVAQ